MATMKKAYGTLRLVEYGRLEEITLGSGGNLPDYVDGIDVADNCNTQSFTYTSAGSTLTAYRTSCGNSA